MKSKLFDLTAGNSQRLSGKWRKTKERIEKKRTDAAPVRILLGTELKIRDSTAGLGFRPMG